jgi:hypothetical protein
MASMDDKGLAPVIAVMLILAIGVTVYSVYTSTYLPGLKQQAEVEHLKEVETGVLRFSTDIDNAIATSKNMITNGKYDQSIEYSETIPLGGGDIMINPMQSGGAFRIQENSTPLIKIISGTSSYQIDPINYSYTPTNNFWMDQGYFWAQGNVTINQPGEHRKAQITNNTGFPRSVVSIYNNKTTNVLNIDLVVFNSDSDHKVVSGNGIVTLNLNATVNQPVPLDHVSFILNDENDPSASELFNKLNLSTQLNQTYSDSKTVTLDSATLNIVQITLSAK